MCIHDVHVFIQYSKCNLSMIAYRGWDNSTHLRNIVSLNPNSPLVVFLALSQGPED